MSFGNGILIRKGTGDPVKRTMHTMFTWQDCTLVTDFS